jgi:hypothetical protein
MYSIDVLGTAIPTESMQELLHLSTTLVINALHEAVEPACKKFRHESLGH